MARLKSDSQNKLHLCHLAICCICFWRINPLENPMSYISLPTFIFQFHSCSGLLALFLESWCFDITDLLIFLTLYQANDSIFLCISCFLDSSVTASCGMALGFLEKHVLVLWSKIFALHKWYSADCRTWASEFFQSLLQMGCVMFPLHTCLLSQFRLDVNVVVTQRDADSLLFSCLCFLIYIKMSGQKDGLKFPVNKKNNKSGVSVW